MKIKQIELTGFKSFSDRKIFQLHTGITCIVGPNGCGKSNIVDAFRWVLGEQSVKSLRGERMEEVIFQGSATVKQRGMAEVLLILSQSEERASEGGNGNPAGDDSLHDKIIVSRRLYRSGESEYYLNKSQCRLKDIRDIFLDTGLDVKSYSILDQGKVSDIINIKPLDRRFLIEEIAGVMKYKVRKNEALSKLESSKQNLQRINDIVYEVKRQINSLDRQVKKAERYKRLIEELKTLELRVAKKEHIRLSDILNSLLAEIERIREVDSSKRSGLSTLETRIETKRLELIDKEKALSEFENSLYSKERDISESEKHIAVLKTGMENRRADISRLAGQQKEFDAKKDELTKKAAELNKETGALSSEMSALSEELQEKKNSVADMEISIAEKETGIENKRKELFTISEDLSNKKNDLHSFQSSIETLKFRESAAIKDIENAKEGIMALEKTLSEAEGNIKAATAQHSGMLSERDALTSEIEKLNIAIEDKKALLAGEREALASNASRLNSLKELTVDRSLMDFMSESQNNMGFSTSVLSDVITANKDYEKAVEAALSERINSIILSRVEDILSIINLIKEKQIGKTALLYTGFNTDRDESLLPQPPPPEADKGGIGGGEPSVLGRASDFVSFENTELRVTAGRILENTFIVKDLESAIELRKTEPFSKASLATLDGEFIDTDGIILAGQGKDILKRKREIKELHKTIQEQQAVITAAEDELNTSVGALTGMKESLSDLGNSIIDIEKEISLIEHSLTSQNDELERNRRKLSLLETEVSAVSGEKESLKGLIDTKTEEINRTEKTKDSINGEITTIQNSFASIRAEYESARTQLTDMRLAIISYKEKMEALQREEANIIHAIEELERNKEGAGKEIQEAERILAESSSELNRLEEAIKALVVEVDSMRQQRAAGKEAIDAENQALAEETNSLKIIRTEIDAISQELSESNSKAVENRLRIEHIENGIMQKYGIDIKTEEIETAAPLPADDTQSEAREEARPDEDRIEQINEKIRDLGPVNLGTIEEYEELKTRYDFLTRQQKDLTMSIAELEEAISRINTSTKKKLREAYDALRTKFTEVFTTLFGGGRADIILTDEENILESGIDIIAQPPGKKLQNINLLSGGEKALTSLSLLFAGFLIKPSPLCILDEVDAPFDESNTVRFAQMLKGLSKETQFIVITHNRTTMEIADYIYGITMEEPGVSKAISLQFTEIESIN